MPVDTTQLAKLGAQLRRERISVAMLTYIDGTMPLLSKGVIDVQPKTLNDLKRIATGKCPVCEARRKAKAAAQKRWRAKK